MRLLLIVSALALAGCATTYPLHVTVDETSETFVGTARSSFKSEFDMTNAAGMWCTGTYSAPMILDPADAVTVHGVMECPDGRKGSWTVAGTYEGGQGVGTLDGKPVRVLFGNMVVKQQIAP